MEQDTRAQVREFSRRLRVLSLLTFQDVPFLEGPRWRSFRADPVGFLMLADDETADRIWLAMDHRCAQADRRLP
jgi:hypothetical protein